MKKRLATLPLLGGAIGVLLGHLYVLAVYTLNRATWPYANTVAVYTAIAMLVTLAVAMYVVCNPFVTVKKY